MPPPNPKPIARQQPDRRPSKASDTLVPASSIFDHPEAQNSSAIDDDPTPTTAMSPSADKESNRMSFSSLYSLGSQIYNSARGSGGPSSIAGSEPDVGRTFLWNNYANIVLLGHHFQLIANQDFEVIIFGDKVILDEEVENWPICDFLISFFSEGFPLDKAIAYAKLRKPFCVNDLPMQTVLWDRRLCLKILDKLNVPTPKRVEVNRDGGPTLPSAELAQLMYEKTGVKLEGAEDGTGGGVKPPVSVEALEDNDVIRVDGVELRKPFVEKPTSGEDHNIHIYFPKSAGGGGRRLFRKINNKSSEADDTLDVPRSVTDPDSSYIYEQFLRVENAEDVKAYTVGPDFCHAETRKSPVVDGVVKRNPNGKEIRYVTSLTKEEVAIASRIAQGFGQRVCGFDLLRTGDKSYVIDVNGWSFVKDNNDYYEKCSSILKQMFIQEKQRRGGTPKQKIKYSFHTKPFIDLLKGHQEEVLLTGELALQSVQDAVTKAFAEGEEDKDKLNSLRNALNKRIGWPGTKVQIKPMFRKRKKEEMPPELLAEMPSESENEKGHEGHSAEDKPPEDPEKLKEWREKRSDSLSGITLSRIAAAENNLILDKLQLIIKWGGEPTHSARYQAHDLGENLRNDMLLMNRDALDDVRVYSSSERRSTTSAQIFATTFLNQQELPHDFITVRKDLLDDSNAAKDEMDKVKKKLKILLRQGNKAPPQFAWPDNMPEPFIVVRRVVDLMKFHRKVMRHNFTKLRSSAASSLAAVAKGTAADIANGGDGSTVTTTSTNITSIQARWCSGEDPELFRERWEKLFKEFCDEEKVDPSKVSELYDTMKFDALHNRQFLEWVFTPDTSLLEEEALEDSAIKDNNTSSAKSTQPPSPSEPMREPPKEQQPHDKGSISQRMGFRRRSEAASAFGSRSKEQSPAPESYFNLFEGVGNGSLPSKAKTDARLERLRELYKLCKVLFDYIGPQEYGITDAEKLEIGLLTSLPLLKEIVKDLEEVQASEDPKSFFYFTKESHIYTLLNCILEGGIQTKIKRNAIPELDYLSQICFELFESQNSTSEDEPSSFNYSIRISLSPGCHTFDPLDVQLDSKHCIGIAQRRSLTSHHDWMQVIETLRDKFHTVKLPKSFIAINLSEKVPQAFGMQEKSDELLTQSELEEGLESQEEKQELNEKLDETQEKQEALQEQQEQQVQQE
ncbi:putative cortical actin cytoskeleton protein asp1 protein [Neofusicoccum parvum UCRNP2]|uniref:Inositol hexakisphosphate and diphosphoinositol-pentakisphosphate kinase n=2 Tax=Neofusicoccum parvum TaxID=310453 RepID=R1EQW2_BOTPV|nr:putative cortical actin cytoskeleton protein asp1 protein [Neofusicoccum parvum UCRNP2]GME23555.1 Inositol hexakisphosphate and diphosphoinositol-pentakisphosphate kinase [Neofusicoccum parvum]